MKHAVIKSSVVAAALSAIVGTASAAVDFYPETGEGYVGKGDVQLAFGWNNKMLQANADFITFSYKEIDMYTAVCTWITGEGKKGEKTHNVSRILSTDATSVVVYDTRVRNQVTGFNLKGLGETTEIGEEPVVGNPCQGGGTGATWSTVTLDSSLAGLFVNFGSESKPIWSNE